MFVIQISHILHSAQIFFISVSFYDYDDQLRLLEIKIRWRFRCKYEHLSRFYESKASLVGDFFSPKISHLVRKLKSLVFLLPVYSLPISCEFCMQIISLKLYRSAFREEKMPLFYYQSKLYKLCLFSDYIYYKVLRNPWACIENPPPQLCVSPAPSSKWILTNKGPTINNWKSNPFP